MSFVLGSLYRGALACCRMRVRYTSLEMPTPPALAKFLEYCSVSIERQTPVPGVSPNGPSPFRPDVICENIALRNMPSKSVAVFCALACCCGETFVRAFVSSRSGRPFRLGAVEGTLAAELIGPACITSPRCRPRSHL